ncbi:MAG: nickel-dependent lactate racemase [Candidatus Krumholzibacteriia bacterium]
MEIKVPYGDTEKTIRVPPEVRVDFLGPAEIHPVEDLEKAFSDACRTPVGKSGLDDVVSAKGSVVVVVSDLTRAKGTEELLPLCIDYLAERGVPQNSITVVVARGTHRQLTKEEKVFLRSGPLAGVHIEEHDCDDTAKLSALMLTRRGTPVRVNSKLKTADAVILLSPVSFHYFAGFGGGRKLVLPGCADRSAIMANHRLSLSDTQPVTLQAGCWPGQLDGNPVHEDMCEAVGALDGVVGINFYSDAHGNIVFMNSGDPIKAHRDASEAFKATHLCLVDEPYDLMILGAGGHPYDINLLQSHKALRHAAGAVRDGGTILYYAQCGEGIGSESLDAAVQMRRDEFLKAAYERYDLNNQTAVSLLGLTSSFEIGMVSAMNVDVLLSCGIKPCVNTESFLVEALEKHGATRIALVPDGANLLLQQKGGVKR